MENIETSWTDADPEIYDHIQGAMNRIRESSGPGPEYMLLPLPDAQALGIDHLGTLVRHELFGGLAIEFDLRKDNVKKQLAENGYTELK